MARVLVVYGSTDGQTRRIAERMAAVLVSQGLEAEIVDSAKAPADLAPGDFDAALVLGSVRMGKHQQALADFVGKFRVELDAIPNAFISVSLSAGRNKPSAQREVAKTFQHFIDRTGWRPNAQVAVAGALPYSRYSLRIRLVMKFISWMTGGDTDTSRDYEYTDWESVEDFARRFASALVQAPLARAAAEELQLH
ncbi:MAG TPA: flavodoxin domain-containing protein [Myxococcales bacterium]|nr:flavodoxin domain-containing protein [Myxococcales bacterium]